MYLNFFNFASFEPVEDEPYGAVFYTPDYRTGTVLLPSTSYFMVL
jgi:hypothetical protein